MSSCHRIFCYKSLQSRIICQRKLCSTSQTQGDPKVKDYRDISRLTPKQRSLLHGEFRVAPQYEKYKRYKRRMYGIYGEASGYDKSILWPGKQELQKLKQYESLWEPTLDTLLAELKNHKEKEENELADRMREIHQKMAKMPELLRQYEAKEQKRLDEEMKREEKRQMLLEEARDFFGYEVDPRDVKFQEMVEKKELAEKQAEKQKKKEQKLARMMAKYKSVLSQRAADKTGQGGGGDRGKREESTTECQTDEDR